LTTPDLLVSAVRHHQAGRLAQAEELYRQCLQADPFRSRAWYLLGAACQAQGKLADAAASLRHALCLQPDFADGYNHLGVTLAEQGNPAEAAANFRQALQFKPDFADAHANLGHALAEQGQFAEAAGAYQQAARLRPGDAGPRIDLGNALLRLGRRDEAVGSFERALRLAPDSAEVRTGWGNALVDLGRLDEAVAQFREALRLRPGHVPAYGSLGDLAREGCYAFSSEEVRHLRDLLDGDDLAPQQRALLHFTLASTLERRGEYDEAFQHYRQGNDLNRQLLARKGRAFNARDHQAFISRLIAAFTPELFRRGASLGLPSEVPVFVVGVPRSGTTLVNHILSAHPDVAAPGELLDLQNLVLELPGLLNAPDGYPECLARLGGREARALAGRYLGHLSQLGSGARRVTDKLPENYLHLGLVALLFPRAHVIHCQRDPLDTCVSCYTHQFRYVRFSTSLEDLGLYYREYERLLAHWRAVLPIRMTEVRYEELVASPGEVGRGLVAACGLDWRDRCLAAHESRRAVHTASRVQVRRPVHGGSVSRWRRFAAHLRPLLETLGQGAADARQPSRAEGGAGPRPQPPGGAN
jgi:tetratricopeptide (TPR) repeat protein